MPTSDPRCVICGEPVRYGELSVFLQGDLVHQDCYTAPADAADLVASFLRKTPKHAYCNICLASLCALKYEAVSKATSRLRTRPEFRTLIGDGCSGCGRPRITFGVRSEPGP